MALKNFLKRENNLGVRSWFFIEQTKVRPSLEDRLPRLPLQPENKKNKMKLKMFKINPFKQHLMQSGVNLIRKLTRY